MESFERIRTFLGRVRRDLDRIALGEAALAAVAILVVGGLLALAGAHLLAEGSGPWAWLALALAGAGVGYASYALWFVPRRARRSDDAVALWIEDRVGGCESELVTGAQVGPLLARDDGEALGFSRHLAREAAERTARRLDKLQPDGLGDRQRLKRLAAVAAGALAVAGLLALAAPTFYSEGARRLVTLPAPEELDGEGRLVNAVVGQLAIEIIPPAYTGLKPRRIDRSSGDIEVLRGSEVRFAGAALYPSAQAVLVLESAPDARWPLELTADGTVRGSFRVGEPDRYQFRLIDDRGLIIQERAWRAVDARVDAPPEVRLLLPETDLEVKPDDQIAFFFEATDDYGLDRVEMVLTDDYGQLLDRRVVRTPGGERIARGDDSVTVARLGLDPGESVEVHFEVFDRNELSGPGMGRSAARRLSLYSPEAEHSRHLAKLDELIDAMIDLLADRLEHPIENQERWRLMEYVAIGQGISASTERVLADLGALTTAFAIDPLATDALRAGLQEVRDRLHDVHEQEGAQLRSAALGTSTTPEPVMIKLLHDLNEEGSHEVERGILALKKLLDDSRRDSILDAGRELLETQNEIMELLKRLQETDDPEAMRAAMRKLQQLQERLKKLQQDLAKLREPAPYDNQNPAQRPSDHQVSMESMDDTMKRIQELLAEGKIEEAMALLEELNRNTQELMAALQDDLGGGGGMSASAQRRGQELATQLDELADGQRGLRSETLEAERAISERRAQELRDNAEEALGRLTEKAAELRAELEGVNDEALHPSDREALEGLRGEARMLEQEIGRGQVERGARRASDLAEQAQALRQEIGESEARELDEGRLGELQEGMGKLESGREKAESIAQELEALQPDPSLTPGEASEMERLAERQQQLQDRLQELREQLRELDEEMPGVESECSGPMEGAGQSMGEARDQLGERDPRQAEGRQQRAIEQLEQAQQSLREQMQQQQQRGGGEEMAGVNDPAARVEIPEEDPYARPRDFREEVMRAMQEQAPERYREAIERFYQELMQ